MNETNFKDNLNVYTSILHRKDLTLSDQADRLWGDINTGLLQFDYNKQKISVLDTVNASTLLEFYNDHVLNSGNYRKMIIAVHGADDEGEIPNITHPLDYSNLNQTTLHYP